jgi:CRISPR-associated protein Cas1
MMPWADTLYGQVKNGVLTLSGYSISVREQNGCLEIIDGLKGRSEVKLRFPRASCPVSRLIIVRSEGVLTLRAVRWLRDVGASLIVLDYDGSPVLVSCPKTNVPAGLHRKQALLTAETPLGASIAHSLIAAKIAGQIEVLKMFMHAAAIDASAYAARINPDMSVLDLLGIEGRVSATYWQALADRQLHFGRRQDVPDHWKTFGSRRSPLTGTPRRAVTPGAALLNYLYSVAASEITVSLYSIGLLPELDCGLHEDRDNRMSLSYSIIERRARSSTNTSSDG